MAGARQITEVFISHRGKRYQYCRQDRPENRCRGDRESGLQRQWITRLCKLIIIKHSDTYLSAYAHNRELIVNEGETVKAGQQISTMGLDGKGAPVLHFEIRKMANRLTRWGNFRAVERLTK